MKANVRRRSRICVKSKLIIIGTAVIALALGFFAGRFQAGRAWSGFFEDYAYTDASNQAHFWIRALTYLQEGQQTNVVGFMESRLDGSLLTFITYEGRRPEERNKAGMRAIKDARDYRSRHPWQNTTPEIRDGVQRVLSLGK